LLAVRCTSWALVRTVVVIALLLAPCGPLRTRGRARAPS